MGNLEFNKAQDNYTFNIIVNKAEYQSGEFIQGRVEIGINEDCKPKSLFIHLKGFEETWWIEEENRKKTLIIDRNNRRAKKGDFWNKVMFLSQRICLKQWLPSEILKKGKYTYEFSFLLPDTLISSLQCNSDKYFVAIKYKIKSIIEVQQKKMKTEQIITVKDQTNDNVLFNSDSQFFKEQLWPIKTWIIFDKGDTLMRCFLERQVYNINDKLINLFLEIDNSQCLISINSITVKLKCLLMMTSNNGVAMNFAQVGINKRKFPLTLNYNNQRSVLPCSVLTGQAFKISYFIDVTYNMDGLVCCQEIPHIQIPITLITDYIPYQLQNIDKNYQYPQLKENNGNQYIQNQVNYQYPQIEEQNQMNQYNQQNNEQNNKQYNQQQNLIQNKQQNQIQNQQQNQIQNQQQYQQQGILSDEEYQKQFNNSRIIYNKIE